MTRFRYVAKDDAGQEHRGTIDAEYYVDAIAALTDQGFTVTSIDEVRCEEPLVPAKRKKSSPWGCATLVAGVAGVWFAFQPCFTVLAHSWLYPAIVIGIIGLLVSLAEKREAQILFGVIGLACCFYGLQIVHMREARVKKFFTKSEKILESKQAANKKSAGGVMQGASEVSKFADDVISTMDKGIKVLDMLDNGVKEIKKGVREIDDVLKTVDQSMKELGKEANAVDKSSKGFDLDNVINLAGKAIKDVDVDKVMDVAGKVVKEVDVDKVMDVAGKVVKEVDVDKVMDVAGKVVKEVDVDKVMDVAGKAVKELDMDKVMKAADEGFQAMDRIAHSLNGDTGALGTDVSLTKEQIKEKIQKWQNDRWKKDVIDTARNTKGTVSASDLAETCETAELQPVMDLLIADYALLVNGLDAYAAASDETAALKAFTSSISASDLAKIRDDGTKLKDALNDLKEKTSLSDVSRMKALASDGMKIGKLALSVGDMCGVVKKLLAEAPQN